MLVSICSPRQCSLPLGVRLGFNLNIICTGLLDFFQGLPLATHDLLDIPSWSMSESPPKSSTSVSVLHSSASESQNQTPLFSSPRVSPPESSLVLLMIELSGSRRRGGELSEVVVCVLTCRVVSCLVLDEYASYALCVPLIP